MTEILYESELFNEKSCGMFPFKIVVERDTDTNGNVPMTTITVNRIEYKYADNTSIPQKTVLNLSTWKNT